MKILLIGDRLKARRGGGGGTGGGVAEGGTEGGETIGGGRIGGGGIGRQFLVYFVYFENGDGIAFLLLSRSIFLPLATSTFLQLSSRALAHARLKVAHTLMQVRVNP